MTGFALFSFMVSELGGSSKNWTKPLLWLILNTSLLLTAPNKLRRPHMPKENREVAFRSALSLTPLLEFWRHNISPKCSYMAEMFNEFEQRLQKIPDLEGPIEDLALLKHHQDLIWE